MSAGCRITFVRLLALWVVAALLVVAAPARASSAEATHYIEAVGNEALSVIKDRAIAKAEKQTRLEKLFVGNVDIPWVGRFVLGRFWRQASAAQKERFLREYQAFLVTHYTSRFTDYTGGGFKVVGSRDDGNGQYTVSMELLSPDSDQSVQIEYRIRQENGVYKIFDIVAEGVSMITTQRSEFAGVLTNHGLDYLIDQLAAKKLSPLETRDNG